MEPQMARLGLQKKTLILSAIRCSFLSIFSSLGQRQTRIGELDRMPKRTSRGSSTKCKLSWIRNASRSSSKTSQIEPDFSSNKQSS